MQHPKITTARLLLAGKFQRIIDAETRLLDLTKGIQRASDFEACWACLRAGSADFGFQGLKLVIDGTAREERPPGSKKVWQLRIPLGEGRYINFFREFDAFNPLILGAFVNSIERDLNGWLAARELEEFLREYCAANAKGMGS